MHRHVLAGSVPLPSYILASAAFCNAALEGLASQLIRLQWCMVHGVSASQDLRSPPPPPQPPLGPSLSKGPTFMY